MGGPFDAKGAIGQHFSEFSSQLACMVDGRYVAWNGMEANMVVPSDGWCHWWRCPAELGKLEVG